MLCFMSFTCRINIHCFKAFFFYVPNIHYLSAFLFPVYYKVRQSLLYVPIQLFNYTLRVLESILSILIKGTVEGIYEFHL